MKTFKIYWIMVPTNFNTSKVATIEAADEKDVRTLFEDAMLQRGLSNSLYTEYVIDKIEEYIPPKVEGKVLSIG